MGELWIFPVNYPFNVERKQEGIDRDVTYDRKFLQLGKTSAYKRTSLPACLVNTHTRARSDVVTDGIRNLEIFICDTRLITIGGGFGEGPPGRGAVRLMESLDMRLPVQE